MIFSAYIRKLETGLALTTRLVAPWPLNRLDRWLLLQYPWLWRTGAIPMFGLAAWLAAAFYAFGHFTPVSSQTMPTINDVSTVWSIMLLIGLIILGLWILSQIRWPLQNMSICQMVLTCLLYAVVIFCIAMSPAAYSIPVTSRMAQTVPDDIFATEYAFHNAHGFWVCTTTLRDELAHDDRRHLLDSLKRYGFNPTFSYAFNGFYEAPDGSSEKLCPDGKPTLIFYPADASDLRLPLPHVTRNSLLFRERLKAVHAAKQAVSNHEGELERISTGSIIRTAVYAFFASLFILLFCPLSRISVGARFLSATWNALVEFRPRHKLSLRRLLSPQPSHHPTLYALAPINILVSHAALAVILCLVISLGLIGDTPDDTVYRLSSGLTYFLAATIALVTPIFLCGSHVDLSPQMLDGVENPVKFQVLVYWASTTPFVILIFTVAWMFPVFEWHVGFLTMILLVMLGSHVAVITLVGFCGLRWIEIFVPVLSVIGYIFLFLSIGMVATAILDRLNIGDSSDGDHVAVWAAFAISVIVSIVINRQARIQSNAIKYFVHFAEYVALVTLCF